MDNNSAYADYTKALRAGMREHRHCAASGVASYVQVLDEIFPEGRTAQQQNVGLMEIPIELIAGTKTAGRQYALSPSFLPLLEPDTEFGSKWITLCQAHLSEEGIHDPIRCFEYYGRFYVQEGNKRVSVMRYFEAPTIPAYVTRLLPVDTDAPRYALYQEFLEFFRVARIYQAQFSIPGSYRKLLAALGCTPWPARWLARLENTRAGGKIVGILRPAALFALLAVCTAFLVDGSFNPFLYFRF